MASHKDVETKKTALWSGLFRFTDSRHVSAFVPQIDTHHVVGGVRQGTGPKPPAKGRPGPVMAMPCMR
jgi:hypothetical protein